MFGPAATPGGGGGGTVRQIYSYGDGIVRVGVGSWCDYGDGDSRNCHALNDGANIPANHELLTDSAELAGFPSVYLSDVSSGHCDDLNPDCSASGGDNRLSDNPFSGCKFPVNLDAGVNGTLTARWAGDDLFSADLADGGFVPAGATVTFVADPDDGFYVSGWTGCAQTADNVGGAEDGENKECEAVADSNLSVSASFGNRAVARCAAEGKLANAAGDGCVSECPAGQENNGGQCAACGDGTYNADSGGSCKICGEGTVGGESNGGFTTCACDRLREKDSGGTCVQTERDVDISATDREGGTGGEVVATVAGREVSDVAPVSQSVTITAIPDAGLYVNTWNGSCNNIGGTGFQDPVGTPQVCVVAPGTSAISAKVTFQEGLVCETRNREQVSVTTCGACLPTFYDPAPDVKATHDCACRPGMIRAEVFLSGEDVLANAPEPRCVPSGSVGAECARSGWDYLNYGGAEICGFGRDESTLLNWQSRHSETRCVISGSGFQTEPQCADVFGTDIPDKTATARAFVFNCPTGVSADRTACLWAVDLTQNAGGNLSAKWSGDSDLRSGETVPDGAMVTFVATPADGYYVSLWAGCESTDDNTGAHADSDLKECATVVNADITAGAVFADIDECRTDANNCDANATCENHTFSGIAPFCTCNEGYDGNGAECYALRTVGISAAANGTVSASSTSDLNIRDGETARQESTVFFTATPTVGFYVSGWTGDCDNNAAATTGEDDPPGTPQSCTIGPGSGDVSAGAEFAEIADCASRKRTQTTATTCGSCTNGFATADAGDAGDADVACLPVMDCGAGRLVLRNGTACGECDAENFYREPASGDGTGDCELVTCSVEKGEVRVGTTCQCAEGLTQTSGNPNSSGLCVDDVRLSAANECERAGWRLSASRSDCEIAIDSAGGANPGRHESCTLIGGIYSCGYFFADTDGDGVPNFPDYDAALDVPDPREFAAYCRDGLEPSGLNYGGRTECITFPTVYVDSVASGGAVSVSWTGPAGYPKDDDLQSGDKVPPGTTVTFAAIPADADWYVGWWTGACESSGAATGADDSGGGEVKTCEIAAERATDITVGVIFEEIVACEPLHRAERSDAVSCGGCLPTFADSDGGRFVTCECPAGTVEVSAFLSDGDFLANTPDRRCVASDSLAAECALSGWDYLDYGGAKICSFGRDGSTLEDAQSGGVRTRCLVGGEAAGDASVGCGDVFGEDIPDKASSAREFFFNCPGDAGFDSARGTCTWTVNLTPGANGSLSASWAGDDDLRNGGTVLHNALVTFTAAPDDNYYVIGWTGCAQTTDNLGRPTDGGDKDCAAVVDFNLTVSASFEARNANRCPDGFYDPDGVAPDGTGVNCVRKRFTLADLNQYCLASGLSSPFATLGTGVGAGAIGSFCFLLADQDRNCFVLNDGVVVETGTVLGDTTPGSQVRSFGAYPSGLCDVVYPDCGESGQVAVEADNPLFGCMDPPSGLRPVNFSRLLFGGSMSAAVGGVEIDSGDLAEEGAEVTFTATPSGAGFYVSEWTGDCENNPTAETGVGDAAGGAAKVCVVVADGRSEVSAGAVFAAAEVCGDVFRGDGDRPDACGECLRGYADAGGAADVGACVAGDVGSAADLCADAGWAVAAGRQFCVVAARVAGEASGASQCYFAQANPAEGNAELDVALRTSSVACGDVFGSPPVFPLFAGGVGVSGNPVLYCAGEGELVSADGTRCVAACPGSQASDGGVNARCVCASGVVTLDGMDCAGECPAGERVAEGQCVCNADREVRGGACVCAEAEAIDVGEGVCAQSRAVSVLGSDNGVVVATVLGAEVAEAGSARSPVTVPVTFVAAPDGGYYVESWTGDCLSNPSAGTGEGDATGGIPKSCVVSAGNADIEAGATFAAVRDCGDENREGADGVLVCGLCSVNYEDFNNDGDCTACDSRIVGSVSEVGGSCGCVAGAITDESLSFLNSAGDACVNRSGCLVGEGPDETGRVCSACVGDTFNPTAGESCMVCENGGTVGDVVNGGFTTCACAGDYTGAACDTLPDCPENSSRGPNNADKCVCDVNYSPASGSPSSGTDVVCALDMRSVSVLVSDGGVVVATVSGLEVSESQATPSPVTEPVTFVATPDGGYYVESWAGDCLSNSSAGTGEGDATGGVPKSCVVDAGSSDISAGAVFGVVRDCGSENREDASGVLVCGLCSVNYEDFNNDGDCTACDSRIAGSVSEVGGSCGCVAGAITDSSLSFLNSAGDACVNRSGCLVGEGPDETGRVCSACVGDEFNPTAGESCMVCMNGGTVGDVVNGGFTTCTCAGDYTGTACDTLPDCPENSSRGPNNADKCVCDVNYSPASGSPSSGVDVVCELDERSVSVLVSDGGVVVATVSGSEVSESQATPSPVTEPVTFVAAPDGGYYVESWTGDCLSNPSAGTGEGDATGGVPKTCVVSAGSADISAGAVFGAVRDCGSESRKEAVGVLVCGTCADDYEDVDGTCSACAVAHSGSTGGAACSCDSDSGYADPDENDSVLECLRVLSASDCDAYGGGLTDNDTACDCSTARGFSGESCDVCAGDNVRTVQGSVVSCESPTGQAVCDRAEGGALEFRDGRCVSYCEAGQQRDSGTGACVACAAGTYNPTAGAACQSCNGITGDIENGGATSCAECENGGARADADTNTCACVGDYYGDTCGERDVCPANSSRGLDDGDKCVCDVHYSPASGSSVSGTDVVCEVDERTVLVLNSVFGTVVATVAGAEVAEGGSADSPVTVPVTFIATPDAGHYVRAWMGDCLGVGDTGEDDAPGAVQVCEVAAGVGAVRAGATFDDIEDCAGDRREQTDATTCGGCAGSYVDTNPDDGGLTCGCPAGSEEVSPGVCGACGAGMFNAVAGAACQSCNGITGDIVNGGATSCAECENGGARTDADTNTCACVGDYYGDTCGERDVCPANSSRGSDDGDKCECDVHYSPASGSSDSGTDVVCELDERTVFVANSVFGTVVATVGGVEVAENGSADSPVTVPVTFIATPDAGYYVRAWTGDCLGVGDTGEDDAPGAVQVCEVAAGAGAVRAGATFDTVEDCAGVRREQASATTCGGCAGSYVDTNPDDGDLTCGCPAGSEEVSPGVCGACGAGMFNAVAGGSCGVCAGITGDGNGNKLDGGATSCDVCGNGGARAGDDSNACACVGHHTGELCEVPPRVVSVTMSDDGALSAEWDGVALGVGDDVPDGAQVTFAAVPVSGYYVSVWTDACADNPNTGGHGDGGRKECVVSADGDVTVGAVFADINECEDANKVNGGCGLESEFRCVNQVGAARTCERICRNAGVRQSDDACECVNNYTGDFCEVPPRGVSWTSASDGALWAEWDGMTLDIGDDVPNGARVTFIATPTVGFYVSGWAGDCLNNPTATTGENDDAGGTAKTCVATADDSGVNAGATFGAVRDCGDENREGADGVLVCGVCSVNYEDYNSDGDCTTCDSRIVGSVSEVGGSCGCVAGAITDSSLSFLNSARDACVNRTGCLVGEGPDETGRVCSACVGDTFNPTAGESCMVCMNGGTVGDVVNGGFTTCTCSGDWTGTACDVLPACPDNASRGSDADKCVCDDEYRVADSSPALSGVDVVCEVLLRTVFAAFSQNGTVVATVAGVEISEGGSALSPVTERVTFTASPGSDYYVKSWTGDCAAERSPVVATTGEGDAPGAVQVCVVAAGGDYTWAGAVFAGVADCAGLNQERTDATTCGSCVGVYVDTNPNDDRFTCGCPVGWEEAGDGCQPCSAGKFNGSAGGSCGVCDGVVRDGDGNKVDAGATRCDVCLNGGTRADVNTNACACVGDYYGDLCGSRDSCPDNSSRDLSEGVAAQCVCDDDYNSPDGAPDRGTSVICVLNERAVSVLVSDNGVVVATVSGMEVSESETTLSPVTVPVTFIAVPDDGYYVTVWTGDCESNPSATTGEDGSPGAVQACVVSAGDAGIQAGAVFAEVADCDGENRIRTSATACGGCDAARHYFDKDGSEDGYECVLPTRANCKSVNKVANNVDDALSTECVVVSEANCARVGEYADPIGHTRTCLESCPNSYGTSPAVPGACSFCEGGRESPDGRTPCACPAGERPTVKSGVCVTGAAMDAAEACEAAGWRLNDDGDRCLVKSVNGDTGVAQSSCDLASGCAAAFGSGFNFPTTIAADAETPREFVYNCGTGRNPAGANTRGETECCDDPTTDDGAGVCRPTAETCGAYGGAAVNDAYDPADRHAHPPCVCGEGDGGTPGTEEGEGCFAAWTIYLSAATNGTLSATAEGDAIRDGGKVSRGATVTFAASPSPGFYVSAWDGCEGIPPESILGGDDDGDAKLCAAAALSDLRVSVSFAEREQCPGSLVNSAGDGCVDFCAAGEELNDSGDACVVCDSGEYNPTPDGSCVVCGDNGTRMSATVCECDSGYAKGASGECVVASPRAEMVGVVAASLVAAPEGNYFVREWVGVTCANDGDATGDADNPGAVKVCELSSATSAEATVGVVYSYSRTATLGTVPADGTGGTVYATVAAAVPEELSDGGRVSSREFVFVVAVPAAGWRVTSWGDGGGVCKDAPTSQDENDTGAKVCVIRPGDEDLNVGVTFESVSSSDPGL